MTASTQASAGVPQWVSRLVGLESVSPEQRDEVACIALAIYYEARGESARGQEAVGGVVMNRKNDKRYPNTACGVLFQKYQFSFLNKNPVLNPKGPLWDRAVEMAKKVYAGTLGDAAMGRLGFYNPKYTKKRVRGIRIGNHVFHF